MSAFVRRNPSADSTIVPGDRQALGFRSRLEPPDYLTGVLICLLLGTSLTGCARMRSMLVDPVEESRHLTQLAREAVEAREFGKAHDLLTEAEALKADDPEIQKLQARVLMEQGNRPEAISELRKAIEQDSTDVASHVQLAQLLVESGQPDEAAKPVRDALQLDPTHVEALLLRARLAEQSGKTDLAMETLHRVLGCRAEQVDAKLQLARLQIESNHAERAAPLLRSISDCPFANPGQRAEAHWSLALVYGNEKRWNDCIREFAAACNLKQDLSDDDWYRVAYARFQAEDYTGAKQAVAKCLGINAQHEGALALSASFETYGWGDTTSLTNRVVPVGFTANAFPTPEGW